jgi:chloride channel protein, CIC family
MRSLMLSLCRTGNYAKSRFIRLHLPLYWQLGLGGLIVGGISIAVPEVWGNGYSVVGRILGDELTGLWLLAILAAKTLATSATVGSGAVGGVFTPTLFIGCAVGSLFGEVLHLALPSFTSVPTAYALVGMGGFLAATTHAPLTSILMLFEMTLDYEIMLPLMLTCVTAHYAAKVYRRGESIYHGSLHKAAATGAEEDWRLRTIETLVKPAVATTTRDTSVQQMLAALPVRTLERVYVIHDDDLVAWLDPRQVFDRLQKNELNGTERVGEIAQPATFALTPEMSLCTALDGFLREQATVLPVTPGQWRNGLLGEVSRRDVLLAIQDRLTYPK